MSVSNIRIAIVWDSAPVNGSIETVGATLDSAQLVAGSGTVDIARFDILQGVPPRLELAFRGAHLEPGAHPSIIQLNCAKSPISVMIRDINAATPVYVPEYGVAITTAQDTRSYAQIAAAIQSRGARSGLQRIEQEPEETFAQAAERNRDMMCPVWLGLGRDMRMFRFSHEEIHGYWGYIQPMNHSYIAPLAETEGKDYAYHFVLGKGSSCRVRIRRWLEDGSLPILRSEQLEEDITYSLTAFATLETRPPARESLRGTSWRAAYAFTGGNMYGANDRDSIRELIEAETTGREEQTVCCITVEAANRGAVPRYAWFRAPRVSQGRAHAFESNDGFSTLGPQRVYAISRINGRAMPQEEMAVLVQPGERVLFEMIIPHQPLDHARATALARLDIGFHHKACRKFWQSKLAAGASVSVPEQAIDDRVKAGLLHLDINTLGREPDEAAMACVGWYAPIGSESAPMIQFFDTMGWHDLARRCLDFFLEHQRADGFIQNFGGYQLETGPFLWTAGEHFRYTRDSAWVRRVKEKLLKACDFLLAWRERNKREELRGKGYGLIDGKVADPEDFFRSYMLNALSYVGLARAAEMLADIDPDRAAQIATECVAYRSDIRTSFYESLARSPVVPLGDGTWAPAPPPWAEYRGPLALFAEGGSWFTHGAFGTRDSLIGSLYLVLGEVLAPDEIASTFMLKTHHELFTVENAGLSQPYYPRHDWIHLLRGEVKPFLKTYYNQLTALQDRQTFTFWEHYWHASQHKTHEEAWFLMQTRWMIALERGRALHLFAAAPREWFADSRRIEIRNLVTYFGPVSVDMVSHLSQGTVEIRVSCEPTRAPRELVIRVPLPQGYAITTVDTGEYDPESQTVRVHTVSAEVKVVVRVAASA